jgi:hypothetical protein
MLTDWVTNPKTKKLVKIGSQTHRRLINEGVLKNTRLDEKVLANYDPAVDDVGELKKQLQSNISDNEIISVGRGRYKNKLVRGYKGAKGRPYNNLEPNTDRSDVEQYIQSLLSTPIEEESEGYSPEEFSE